MKKIDWDCNVKGDPVVCVSQRLPNCESRPQLRSICNLPGVAWQFAWGRLTICLGSPDLY